MKKLRIGSLWRYLATGVVVTACLLLSSTVSLGDISSPTGVYSPSSSSPQTDCRLSPNPDECYHKASQQQWSPYDPTSALPRTLNTQTLGLEGPFSMDLRYDADLSWILGLKYVHMFSESAGIATKLTGGPKELRANITAGYAFTKDHQVKLTYEYLTQNLPFDFASGTVNEWVGQHSIGAAYQYVIRHEIVHSLELSGYITRAGSKDLDSVAFNQQVITPGQDYLYDVNFRRIAGGSENTVMATVNLFPFANDKTTLTLGGGYSSIKYDTLYEDSQSASRPAFKAELTHLLSSRLKFTASSVGTAASTEHSIGFSQLLPHHVEATIKGQYTAGQGTLADNKSITLGLTYPAGDSYSLAGFTEVQELRNWIDKPIIYATRVLAIKDEMVQQYEFKSNGALPDQIKFFGQLLDPVASGTAFTFTDPNLQITYTVTTIKTSLVEGEAASTRDYTKDLNLALVSNGANKVTLQSATSAGIPEKDSKGASTIGTYIITITASGVASGAAPIVLTNGFKLTVDGTQPPTWDTSPLRSAEMGFVYPPDLTPEVDLTAKVTLHGSDTSVTFDVGGAIPGCQPPTWVAIANCTNKATHKCLVSKDGEVVPKNEDIHSFCVPLVATGHPSMDAAVHAFSQPVIQASPVWTLPAVNPTVKFDDLNDKIYLNPYITQNTKNLSFALVESAKDQWALDSDSSGFFIHLKKPFTTLGTTQVPLEASNATSYGSVPQNLPVNIINSDYTVEWTNNTLTDAAVEAPYAKPLNQMNLLVTKNGTTPVADNYTFKMVSGDPSGDWKVSSDGQTLLYKTGQESIPATEFGKTVKFVLTAVSTDTNEPPSGGPGGIPPDYHNKEFTLTIGKNTSFTVKWIGNTLPKATVYTPYNVALNSLNLVQTNNGTTPVAGDTYTFKKVSTEHPNWIISSDGKNLQYKDGLTPVSSPLRDVTLTLVATSVMSGNPTTQGGDPDNPGQKTFTVTVGPNSTLEATWTANTLTTAFEGLPYSKELNPMNLLQTMNGETKVADTYTFTKVAGTTVDWDVVANKLVYKTGVEPLPSGTTATIKLKATSDSAGGKDANPPEKDFTLTISAGPTFGDTTKGEILFDTTGDEAISPELGKVSDGVNLNQMVESSGTYPDLNFDWDTAADPKPHTNWDIKREGPQYYLVRVRNTSVTPATVSAEDVSLDSAPTKVDVPSIKACIDTDHKICASTSPSGSSGPKVIKVRVKPDTRATAPYTGITYVYKTTAPAAMTLVSATSDGKGGRAILPDGMQPKFDGDDKLKAPESIYTSTTTTGAAATRIVNDSATIYTSLKPYITYDGSSNVKLLAPNTQEFADLAAVPSPGEQDYFSAASNANGAIPVTATRHLVNLPPIQAGELILVPRNDQLINGSSYSDKTNLQPNVGVGINVVTGTPCDASAHQTITSLVVYLPPVANKNYYLTQMNSQYTLSAQEVGAGVCKGMALVPSSVPYPASAGQFCSEDHVETNTWSAENIIPKSDSGLPKCSVAGAFISVPTNFSGSQLLGSDGYFTFFANGGSMNRGLTNNWDGAPDFPNAYFPNMTGLGVNHTAPMLGTDYTSNIGPTPTITGYPRVVLK